MIEKLLIANRGEIARRVMRTCRAMGIATVAVYSDPDRTAPFVAEADEAVALQGATPAESYLAIEAILEAAARTGADAVHPGYGFLAENAEFARRCAEAGLVFIGPSPDTIAARGSKIEAKRLRGAAGVPVVPGAQPGGPEDLEGAAAEVGYPLLLKASAGGGGKGMRIVAGPDQLTAAAEAARREAAAAFGDDTLLIERYLENPRHVEVQIFGDTHGNLVHLFERECSIQRRYQKIVEESPSPAVGPELRERMGSAAVAAAKAVSYVSAGTVEFLLAGNEFYFLEMNTRLQVEHPVTEAITGLDLVRLQILVAQGLPLPEEALQPRRRGHAIEARLYAEDPTADFLPVVGTLHRFRILDDRVRVDSGVEDGSVVSPHYDPMLAKVIAHAPTREEAARRLAAALAEARIHGLTTNRELLVRVLRHPEFQAGATDTHFLRRHDPVQLGGPLTDLAGERLNALASALAAQAGRRAGATVLRTIPSGWRNNPSQLQTMPFEGERGPIVVGYRFTGRELEVEVDGERWDDVEVVECRPDLVDLSIATHRRRFDVHRLGRIYWVDGPAGPSTLVAGSRFPRHRREELPGSLHAPMPGKVIKVEVSEGDRVVAGQVLVIIEAMKMEHSLRAPHDGLVATLHAAEGEQVESEQLLVVVES